MDSFLKLQLGRTTSYKALYYGTSQNKLYNGIEWVPSEDYDLRVRPWYLKAVEEKRLITTSIYLNANNDQWVVTYAKPLYNQNNEMLGVIAGDNTMDSIIEILRRQQTSENGFVFFLDDKKNIIMHSKLDNNDKIRKVQLEELIDEPVDNYDSIHKTTIDGSEGYLAWHTIDETGWIIGNFVPIEDFLAGPKRMELTFLAMILGTVLIFVCIFVVQKKYVIKPLKLLNEDIQKISINEDVSYRLPLIKSDPLNEIRLTANQVLEKTNTYFDTMSESRKALALSQEKNSAIIDMIPDCLFIFDSLGRCIESLSRSKAGPFCKNEKLFEEDLDAYFSEHDQIYIRSLIRKAIVNKEVQSYDFEINFGHETSYYELRMIGIQDDQALIILRNITNERENLLRIEQLSYNDQLTGLYNRRFLKKNLND